LLRFVRRSDNNAEVLGVDMPWSCIQNMGYHRSLDKFVKEIVYPKITVASIGKKKILKGLEKYAKASEG
jgi:hypothetical protein